MKLMFDGMDAHIAKTTGEMHDNYALKKIMVQIVHTAEFRSYYDGNYWNRIGGTPEPARRISGTTQ